MLTRFTRSVNLPRPRSAEAGFLRVQSGRPSASGQKRSDEKRHVIAAEDVCLFAIDLPVRRARERRQAAAFAVEEKLGCALEDVHVALGPRLGSARVLVAVLALDKMPRDAAQPVIPEQMLLPAPKGEDALTWHALRSGERVLVRASDGTGFATDLTRLDVIWRAFACPHIVAGFGEALPEVFRAAQTVSARPEPALADLKLDLRQGAFSPSPNILRQAAAAACAIALVGSAAQGALAVRDVLQLEEEAAARMLQAQAALEAIAPGLPLTSSGVAALDRLIAQHSGPKNDPFLSLVAKISSGLLASGDQVTLMALDYDAASGAGGLELQATSLDALRAASGRLEAQGLRVDAGAVTAGDGLAQTRFTVRELQNGA